MRCRSENENFSGYRHNRQRRLRRAFHCEGAFEIAGITRRGNASLTRQLRAVIVEEIAAAPRKSCRYEEHHGKPHAQSPETRGGIVLARCYSDILHY
jgi:hypothetical protein